MKKVILPITISVLCISAFALSSCGGGGGTNGNDTMKSDSGKIVDPVKVNFSDVCKDPSNLMLTVKGYKYGMKGDFEFAGPFEVKQASLTWDNDSSAHLKLSNYAMADLVGDRKDNQIDINVDLRSRNGHKIGAATYTNKTGGDFTYFTTMTTSKGTVYFNWVDGMPNVGNVILNFAEGAQACGNFALASEKPDSDQIGTVRLAGNFTTGQ